MKNNMLFAKDPVTSPFNEWLTKNGIFIAVGVAAVLLIVLLTLLILSKNKKR